MQPGSRSRSLTAWRSLALIAIPKSAAEDQADVARVLAGEVAAFEGIVRRWQGPLVNMAWRYCRDRGRAEALAANVYRTELKRFPTETLPLEEAPEPAGAATQLRELEERGRHEVLRRAVLALPPRYREPVVLYYFHEMDVAAAAATMGLPEGTVKARLSRARALLRQRFPHLEPAEEKHGAVECSVLTTGKEA
jgi:RNA polymerase sigma-70 factor (ECF subfamily)